MTDVIWWSKFCGNKSAYDAFWSEPLTINTTTPDFTNCFQNSVLVWVPSIFLLVSFCVYIPYIWSYIPETKGRGFSKLGVIQLIGECLLIILNVCDVIYLITQRGSSLVHAVDYTAAVIKVFTYILVLSLHVICARRGVYNTGVAFIFWFITLLAGVVTFRSLILQYPDIQLFRFSTFYISFAVVLLEFVCTLIPDRGSTSLRHGDNDERTPLLNAQHTQKDDDTDKKDTQMLLNPSLTCSFPSHMFLSWFAPLVLKGYKRELTLQDIWRTRLEDSSVTIVKQFDSQWKRQVSKDQSNASEPHECESETPTEGSGDFSSSENSQSIEAQSGNRKDAKGSLLFWALFRSFGAQFGGAGLLVALYFTGILLNPFLLQAIIDFVDSDDVFVWRGYVYGVAMFALGIMNPICFHHHLLITCSVSLRIRTALTAAIYRKALKLSATAKRSRTSGEIVNLMSIDVQKIQDAVTFLHYAWVSPPIVVIALYFLWQLLGPSCLAGLVYMFGVLPGASQYIARKVIVLQKENMELKDERLKVMNQVLSGIKVLKLYAWEPHFEQRLAEIRKRETDNLRKFWLLVAASNVLWICTPFIVAVLCFTTFVLSDSNNVLDAQTAFVSLSYLNIMTIPLNVLPYVLMFGAQSFVSVKRISQFLQADEIAPENVSHDATSDHAIRISEATFSWGERKRSLLEDVNLEVSRGKLVGIVGEVGSGKSSLIAAILGEMVKLQGSVNVVGSQAYVPQQAWIQNLTLKDNILFGKTLNEYRYKEVIDQCALEHDLQVLPGGDLTEIGERGINLSGGQKQRVSLARAVYQDADIYLLDDPLSAVDAHVGKHIFTKVIGPQGCLQHKTRIFVTNQIQYLKYVDEVVVMDSNVISERGSYAELLQHNGAFAQFMRTHLKEVEEQSDEEVKKEMRVLERALSNLSTQSDDLIDGEAQTKATLLEQAKAEFRKRKRSRKTTHRSEVTSIKEEEEGKKKKKKEELLVEETMEKGTIEFSVVKWYVHAASYVYCAIAVVGLLFFVAAQAGTNIWLSIWSNDASLAVSINSTVDENLVSLRLGVYGGLGLAQVVFTTVFSVALALASVKAAKLLHDRLLSNVLQCPMSFFDTTPLGRIINRFSKDIDYLDKNLPEFIQDALLFGAPLISTFIVIIYSVPIFTAVFIPLLIFFIIIQRVYTHCARQLKRLDSIKRSPIYNFFSETLNGVTSIRAYGCEERFVQQSDALLDQSQSVWYTVYTSNRWIGLAGEILADFVVLFTMIFAVLQRDTLSAGLAGLAVTYSLQVSIDLTLLLRTTCELETYIVAVERVKEYAEHPTEAAWEIENCKPVSSWPSEGTVEFSNYNTRYRPGLDLVLKGVCCKINPAEKVGVVGRTGAGKSSLALALFRIIESVGGNIIIDGENIARFGLHDVRSRLTVIPQDPVLFSGSLRFNLDPAGEKNDNDLWSALEHAHLKTFVETLPSLLEYECGEDGENLSVGQRQLVCLARALLRKSKILVLDEATASVDMETDSLIQRTIREEFKKCTVITVAHRLNTILDYDRIMVMDAGSIREFDSPSVLLQDKESSFYSMAKDAGVVS